MIHKLFSIFDEKAKAYLPPFILHQTAMAIRSFSDACKDPEHRFHLHPEDYCLYQIGIFDDETATISELKKTAIITGLETDPKNYQLDDLPHPQFDIRNDQVKSV